MIRQLVCSFGAAGILGLALAGTASADSLSRPGSLLVYPQFNNARGGALSLLTVTNTNADHSPAQTGTLAAGTVDVEFIYRNAVNCLEFNRTRRLTPNDTITVVTQLDNPNQMKGYAYVFAKSPTTGKAIAWDWLIGDSLILDASRGMIGSLQPVVYKAGEGLVQGADTDLDSDNVRDMNGLEYEQTADEILVPRFLAQVGASESKLILLNLTGGAAFTSIIDFLIYNSNEEVFSAQYAFNCWRQVPLSEISGAFTPGFLASTNYDLSAQLPIQHGWFRMDGNISFSSATSFLDPAFLAVLADNTLLTMPFGIGEQANGDLLPLGVLGDSN